MKSQKIWLIASYLVLFAGLIKCLTLFFSRAYPELLFWIIGIAWITRVIFSFRFNKNLPGVGPFSYGEGENQEARTIYTMAIIATFILALIFS
ncbi:hypothetical protein [Glaciimonas soli]|uniref:Uncharacterized protein n=1 Tax=Glaciimonas soli TaxID=2590999 RepID=A0A843YQQ0_9BURK|nr:hypothetical protein [Glaciimonas soli]MQQ99817.1 hypothetical protein [Glaciimonas soli]